MRGQADTCMLIPNKERWESPKEDFEGKSLKTSKNLRVKFNMEKTFKGSKDQTVC